MIGTKKVAGIIAEYNPFHAGHKYHIEKTREVTGADYVVVVMSGNFVQRGEPAVVNKYLRAKSALMNGADLVIELPMVYATGSAQYFAFGAVNLLEQLGYVDYLTFGSEWAEIELVDSIARVFEEEPEEYRTLLQNNLSKGMSFPRARAKAAADYIVAPIDKAQMKRNQDEIIDFLLQPNHILAVEYMEAIHVLGSSMKPVAIKREKTGYHDEDLGREYSSATAIRKAFEDKVEKSLILETMADGAEEIIAAYDAGETVEWDDLLNFFNYNYLYNNRYLEKYFGMNLELARRMEHNYKVGMHFDEMMEVLHTKNMTDSALKRALLHIVLKTEEAPYLVDSKDVKAPYIRVLGMRKRAGELLGAIRDKNGDTVIQRPVLGPKVLGKDRQAQWMYQEDIMSANLYEHICAMKCGRYAKDEFERPQIIIESE